MNNSVDFVVEGGHKLSGEVVTNTSKNGAMGLLCGSLLNKGQTILHGIPKIEEVNRILEVMQSIGIKFEWIEKNTLKINPPKKLDWENIDKVAAGRTRTILMFLGPLIHLMPNFELPGPKGCNLGKRPVSAHLLGLQKLGVKVKLKPSSYLVEVKKLKAGEIVMYEKGDTATENILMAASKIPGKTVIKFASSNYMVRDVCYFLEKLGVKIEGIGTHELTVHGVSEINQDVEFYNSEDPIESMMFVSAAVVTESELTIKRVPIDFMELELLKLETMGLKYKRSKAYLSQNGYSKLVDLTVFPSKLKAPIEKITSGAYPDINIDNLPFFVPIACKSEGMTLIHDWVYENRSIYFMELNKLGANLLLADPHRVYVEGGVEFQASQVVCPPALRPAMIILIAMLDAKGTSILRNVYSIKRGYQEIAERLNQLGAKITILEDK
jgi:UDP-N-acetylglucosamine 1-carboxyvinyltransferase